MWHQVQAEQLSECTSHRALQFASACLKGVGPVLQFIDPLGARSAGYVQYPLSDAVWGSPKLSQMCCLLPYVCVLAGRKDTPNQNAGGKIVFSVSIGCSSNPKADIGAVTHQPWHGTQASFLAKCIPWFWDLKFYEGFLARVEGCWTNRKSQCPGKNNHFKPCGCLGGSALSSSSSESNAPRAMLLVMQRRRAQVGTQEVGTEELWPRRQILPATSFRLRLDLSKKVHKLGNFTPWF